jgi:hypothetical protein
MNICHVTDEYMGLVKVKLDDPYIHWVPTQIDEYNIICASPKIGKCNLNIFIGTDKFKTTDE